MTLRKISADFIFPGNSSPIPDGVIILENHKIKYIGKRDEFDENDLEIYEGFICPGFINTHCHLELSYLKNKIPEKLGLDGFLNTLVKERNHADEELKYNAIATAEAEMIVNGIVAVGDILNGMDSFDVKDEGNLYYYNFIELFGLDKRKANLIFNNGKFLFDCLNPPISSNKRCTTQPHKSLTPHTFYSVSENLFKKIISFNKKEKLICSIHNQEAQSENDLFKTKSGKMVDRFKDWKILLKDFKPTGKSSLISRMNLLPEKTKILLVHNTFTGKKELAKIKKSNLNIYWCFCPNANLYIENTLPDIPLFIRENVKITLGTDSLASNHSLSILEEMKTISKHFPKIKLETLLQWGCSYGAEFLGFDKFLGSIENNKCPGLNLIKDVDIINLKLIPKSFIQVLDRV